jgi:hypothetical protein
VTSHFQGGKQRKKTVIDTARAACYGEVTFSGKGGADMACKSKGPCGTAKKPAAKKTASKKKK